MHTYRLKCKAIQALIGLMVDWLPCVRRWRTYPQWVQDATSPDDWFSDASAKRWESWWMRQATRLSEWASEHGYYLH